MSASERGLDTLMLALWLVVLCIGIAMVGSASMYTSDYGDGQGAFGPVIRHSVFVGGAVVAALLCFSVPLHLWYRAAPWLFLLLVVLLSLVLIDGIGRRVNGALRWLDFRIFTLQTAEIAKIGFVLFAARYMAERRSDLADPKVLIRFVVLLALVCALLILEPDFGSAVVIAFSTFVLMFLAHTRLLHLAIMAMTGVVVLAIVAQLEPYRIARLLTYQDPWADQFGAGYQLTQALIAIGRGDWLGVGLGDSVQKLFYLPEAHNDFLFAVIAEETGVIGASVVVLALLGIALRALWVGHQAEQSGQIFGALLAYGIGVLIGTQTLVNVGVNTGLLPTKGLTLPFVSYGGNSLMVSGALIGLALRVHWETVQFPRRSARRPVPEVGEFQYDH